MMKGAKFRVLKFKEKDIIAQRDQVVNGFFFRKTALFQESVLTGEIMEDVEESLYMLLCWHRDLLVSKFTQRQHALLNIDRFEEISSYAAGFSKEKLQKDLLTVMKTIGYIRRNINPKIALFNMAVELK